jgi:hypothetical protein
LIWSPRSNVWWSVQVMKFLIMQSSPPSYKFLPLSSEYSPQHPLLKPPPCLFFSGLLPISSLCLVISVWKLLTVVMTL